MTKKNTKIFFIISTIIYLEIIILFLINSIKLNSQSIIKDISESFIFYLKLNIPTIIAFALEYTEKNAKNKQALKTSQILQTIIFIISICYYLYCEWLVILLGLWFF